MAKNRLKTMEAKSSVAAGAATYCGDMTSPVVQIAGITTGTVKVQASADGSAWFDCGSALTANGMVDVDTSFKTVNYVRANTTAYTSGTFTACVTGKPNDE